MTAKDNAHHIADKSNAPATESNAPATATTVKDHGSNNNVVSVPIETKAAHGTSIKSCNEGTDNSDNSPTITTTDNNTKCDHDSGNVNACMEVGYFFNEHYVIKPPRCDDSAFGWVSGAHFNSLFFLRTSQ